jgi:hypothetical protein
MSKGVEPGKNKWYQFFMGLLLGAGKLTEDLAMVELNLCLPPDWGVAVDYAKISEIAAKAATEAVEKVNEASKLATEAATKAVDATTANESALVIRDAARKLSSAISTITDNAKRAAMSGKAQQLNPNTGGKNADPAKAGDAATDEVGVKAEVEKVADKSTFEKVMDVVQKVVDFACQFKDKVKALFARRLKKFYRQRKFRNFIEKRSTRSMKVSSLNFWEDATGFFGKIGDAIEKTWDEVKDIGKWVFEKLKEKVEAAINWVKSIIASTFVMKAKAIIECVIKYKAIPQQIVTTATGIEKRMVNITKSVKEAASVFIDLICNLSKFRDAFATLDDAKNKEKDLLIQWKKYGLFVGKLFFAIGN